MRLLLTGATGFAGRNLLLSALRRPEVEEIILPLRDAEKLHRQLAEEGIDPMPGHVRVIPGEAGAWRLDASARRITHAVLGAGLLFGRSLEQYRRVNVDGTLALLKQLPPECSVILLSSQSASGPTPAGVEARRESHPPQPTSYYGQSKLEMETAAFARRSKNLLVLRPPMILGPRDTASLPLFKMARSRLRLKPGVRAKEFSWIAAADLVSAVWRASAAGDFPPQALFVCSEGTLTDSRLILTAAEVTGRRGWTLPMPQPLVRMVAAGLALHPNIESILPSLSPDRARELWPWRWVVDGGAFARLFDWKPSANPSDTLAETHAWYVRSGALAAVV